MAQRDPIRIPIHIARGETRVQRLTVTKVTDGSRQDLTGGTVYVRVKVALGSAEHVTALSKVTGAGITHLTQSGETLGQADVTWAHADSVAVTAGAYVYSVWAVDAAMQYQPVIDVSDFVVELNPVELA